MSKKYMTFKGSERGVLKRNGQGYFNPSPLSYIIVDYFGV